MDREEISKYLLDSDGSTRDITFTPANRENVLAFMKEIFSGYKSTSLNDNEGESITPSVEALESCLNTEEGYIHGVFESNISLIRNIQVFLDWPEDGKFGVELSYFPQDINSDLFEFDKFFKKIYMWWDKLESEEIFIRYENASWEWYNPKDLGVFYHEKRPNKYFQPTQKTDG